MTRDKQQRSETNMDTTTYQRFQSGDLCIESGWYEFDGYVDDVSDPLPALSQMEITLAVGQVFPPIQDPRRACYWKLVEGIPPRDRAPQQPSAGSA
jgi:hypothetical protein